MELHTLTSSVEMNGRPDIVREVRSRLSIHDANPPVMTEPLMKRFTVILDGQPYPNEE